MYSNPNPANPTRVQRLCCAGEGGRLAFGPELMVALKGTVVTAVNGSYYTAHDGIEIEIVVKIGFLPRMTIAASHSYYIESS